MGARLAKGENLREDGDILDTSGARGTMGGMGVGAYDGLLGWSFSLRRLAGFLSVEEITFTRSRACLVYPSHAVGGL